MNHLSEQEESLLPHQSPRVSKPRLSNMYAIGPQLLPWILSLCFLIGWVIEAEISPKRTQAEVWNKGELEIAQRELSLYSTRLRATGGLRYNQTGHLIRQIEDDVIDYVGHPTKETDEAWERLVSTTDIFLTEDEVAENIRNGGTFADFPKGDSIYTDPLSGLYQAVPTVFHDLHCLNNIRRAVYSNHYPADRAEEKFWPHVQHCLDTIRQSLMCHSDLTPIPEAYTPYKPHGSLEPIFQVYHTCRDFEAVKKWAKTRDALDGKVWRANAERLKKQVVVSRKG